MRSEAATSGGGAMQGRRAGATASLRTGAAGLRKRGARRGRKADRETYG
jgi:hypothetical protein